MVFKYKMNSCESEENGEINQKARQNEKKGQIERKVVRVPSLDFTELKDNIIVERGSSSEGSRGNTGSDDNSDFSELSEILKSNRETHDVIEEIKVDLDIIKSSIFKDRCFNKDLKEELKEIKNRITVIIPDSPKTLSKCDAIVGNTQMLMGSINRLELSINDIGKINTDHYLGLLSCIMSLNRDVDRIQMDINDLKRNYPYAIEKDA
jgi:hypothetical protein